MLVTILKLGPRKFQVGDNRDMVLSGGYVWLKIDWDIPLECGEFKDTNNEAEWVGILFSTTQKLKKKKKKKIEFF